MALKGDNTAAETNHWYRCTARRPPEEVAEFVKIGVQFACVARFVVAQRRDVILGRPWHSNVAFPLADRVMREIIGPFPAASNAPALVTPPQELLTLTE